MRFGLMLDHQFPKQDDLGKHIDSMIRLTERARDLGFGALFGIHHFLAGLRTPQPFQLLARLIPHSGDMLLGTGVYVATLTHPVQLAEEIATLDQLSGGRFVFGAGIGYRDEEFDSFGIDRRQRGARFIEALSVIEGLWGDEPFSFSGEHFRINAQQSSVQPLQRPRVPFWIGANTPATIARAARLGDAWLASPNVKHGFAAGNLESFRQEWAKAGKAPGTHVAPIARELHLAETDTEARRRADAYLREEYLAYSQYDLEHFISMYDELMEKSFLVGSAATVADKIATYERAGFDTMLFRVFWSGMPYELALESLERFAADVMPRFVNPTS